MKNSIEFSSKSYALTMLSDLNENDSFLTNRDSWSLIWHSIGSPFGPFRIGENT
jgi:hypothetical protein